jgi:hypothetical protein
LHVALDYRRCRVYWITYVFAISRLQKRVGKNLIPPFHLLSAKFIRTYVMCCSRQGNKDQATGRDRAAMNARLGQSFRAPASALSWQTSP